MKRKKCSCPIYCRFCGARLKRDPVGHLCPSRNCQWEHGVPGCMKDAGNDKEIRT